MSYSRERRRKNIKRFLAGIDKDPGCILCANPAEAKLFVKSLCKLGATDLRESSKKYAAAKEMFVWSTPDIIRGATHD